MTSFLADVVLTGTVSGLDHTSTPGEVHGEFEPPLSSSGLIEFGWRRDRVTYGSSAARVEVLAHRRTRTS
jgi:hypothetical protein